MGRGVKGLRGGDGARVCGARQRPGTHELHWEWEWVGGSWNWNWMVVFVFAALSVLFCTPYTQK